MIMTLGVIPDNPQVTATNALDGAFATFAARTHAPGTRVKFESLHTELAQEDFTMTPLGVNVTQKPLSYFLFTQTVIFWFSDDLEADPMGIFPIPPLSGPLSPLMAPPAFHAFGWQTKIV